MKNPFRNIVIAGDVGVGSSTLGQNLAKKLGWEYRSAGDFFRAYAKENNLPLWDKASIPDEVDKRIDNELIDKIKNGKGYVFDTHYGGWFARNLPDVFKILLTCDRDVATQRILERKHTHDETPEEIEKRREGLYAKFKKLYSDDNYEGPKYFNLVIDTTNSTPEETLQTALKSFRSQEN